MLLSPERPLAPQSDQSWLDADLLRVAREIYHAYLRVHVRQMRRPSGVVIHPKTYRGLLVFSSRPILLPQERFIPIDYIDSELS
ncbi:hypothetical protein ACL6C3_01320 [Capilliphycus salinus ALCB114379]|uniref:hypothetical protein n=1 Tax=Capilliphycus salinus TaxID=2768948 RepID=UPI0039A6F0D2